MHELGIVFHMIDTLEDLGREQRLSVISKVTLELGEVSGVLPDYLQDCWRWAADKRDLLRGAELEVVPIHALCICNDCGTTYATLEHGRICPACESEHTELLCGREIQIDTIVAA
ncbi:MAG: hydrogenase maturation nickel metallochaperone HypA [Atopobiaceae bacterium]|nr:hydrogenase maturation nickel metallochaperone HypA [Atopobiaceae bacterium]